MRTKYQRKWQREWHKTHNTNNRVRIREFVRQMAIEKYNLIGAIGRLYHNGRREKEIYKFISNYYDDGIIYYYLKQYAKITIMHFYGCDNGSHILHFEYLKETRKIMKMWSLCLRFMDRLMLKSEYG